MNKMQAIYKAVIMLLLLLAVGITTSCKSTSAIRFPVKVGVNPESITKGFNNDYYGTVMNENEPGDTEVVQISADGARKLPISTLA